MEVVIKRVKKVEWERRNLYSMKYFRGDQIWEMGGTCSTHDVF
jgi:hypothetical protein